MGDMADFFMGEVMQAEDARLDYLMGGMSTDEAIEYGILDDAGFLPYWGTTVRGKTCRCCGTRGLHWEQVNGKWRLFSRTGEHQCKSPFTRISG